MTRFKDLLQWQKISGQPIIVNDFTLTPQSQSLTIRFPQGAFVWNRPTTIQVERNKQVEYLPIVDLTRTIQLGLFGLGAVIIVLVGLVQFTRRRGKAS